MLCKIILITFLGFLISETSSSKILVVHTTVSQSHMIIGKALYTELANQGHEITVITTFPMDKPLKNYRDIYVPLSNKILGMMQNLNKKLIIIYKPFPCR